jgi:hypothetical protein
MPGKKRDLKRFATEQKCAASQPGKTKQGERHQGATTWGQQAQGLERSTIKHKSAAETKTNTLGQFQNIFFNPVWDASVIQRRTSLVLPSC